MSDVISEDGSVTIFSDAEDTVVDAEDASADGGAVDWTFVDDAGGGKVGVRCQWCHCIQRERHRG